MHSQAVRGGGYYVLTPPVVPMSLPCQHRHFSLRTNTERRWNFWEVITTTNRWTDYILSEIVPGTREQDTTEYSNRRQTGAAAYRITSELSRYGTLRPQGWRVHYTHAAAGIIWPRAAFSSIIRSRLKSAILLLWKIILQVFDF